MEQQAKEAASHAAIPVSISAMLVTLGVVYGDIGTSPMYVTKALVAGNGFTEESLAAADVAVKINGVKTNATVNLATAEVTATGSATSVKPLLADGSYKALIVPQSVGQGNLITVTVDGRDFTITVKEKVKKEGAKRPVVEDVDKTFGMDDVKYTKYLISFK